MTADTGRGLRNEALTGLAELRQRQGQPEAALELLDAADPTTAGMVVRAACLLDPRTSGPLSAVRGRTRCFPTVIVAGLPP